MTAEGVYPKIDGDILYDGDVNPLNRGVYQFILEDKFSTTTDLTVTDSSNCGIEVKGVLNAAADFDKANSTNCVYSYDNTVIGATEYDALDDSSIDAALWTITESGTGVITEGSDGMHFPMNHVVNTSAMAKGTGASFNLKTADCTVALTAAISNADAGCTVTFYVDNGTGTTDIIYTVNAQSFTDGLYEFYVDVSGTQVKWRVNGGTWSSWVALTNTGAGSTWYFKIRVNHNTTADGAAVMRYLVYIQGVESCVYRTNIVTYSETMAQGLFGVSFTTGDATSIVYSYTADNAANWNTLNGGFVLETTTDTGTQCAGRVAFDTPADAPVHIRGHMVYFLP